MVDQDFADVAATRDQMASMFSVVPSRKSPQSPRSRPRKKEKSANTMAAKKAKPEGREAKHVMTVENEKMAGLPTLFPPGMYTLLSRSLLPYSGSLLLTYFAYLSCVEYEDAAWVPRAVDARNGRYSHESRLQ
jgi:hypothetical protein